MPAEPHYSGRMETGMVASRDRLREHGRDKRPFVMVQRLPSRPSSPPASRKQFADPAPG